MESDAEFRVDLLSGGDSPPSTVSQTLENAPETPNDSTIASSEAHSEEAPVLNGAPTSSNEVDSAESIVASDSDINSANPADPGPAAADTGVHTEDFKAPEADFEVHPADSGADLADTVNSDALSADAEPLSAVTSLIPLESLLADAGAQPGDPEPITADSRADPENPSPEEGQGDLEGDSMDVEDSMSSLAVPDDGPSYIGDNCISTPSVTDSEWVQSVEGAGEAEEAGAEGGDGSPDQSDTAVTTHNAPHAQLDAELLSSTEDPSAMELEGGGVASSDEHVSSGSHLSNTPTISSSSQEETSMSMGAITSSEGDALTGAISSTNTHANGSAGELQAAGRADEGVAEHEAEPKAEQETSLAEVGNEAEMNRDEDMEMDVSQHREEDGVPADTSDGPLAQLPLSSSELGLHAAQYLQPLGNGASLPLLSPTALAGDPQDSFARVHREEGGVPADTSDGPLAQQFLTSSDLGLGNGASLPLLSPTTQSGGSVVSSSCGVGGVSVGVGGVAGVAGVGEVTSSLAPAADAAHALATLASAALNRHHTNEIKTEIEENPKPSLSEEDTWYTVGIVRGTSYTVQNYISDPNVDLSKLTLDNLPELSGLSTVALEPGTAYKFRVAAINTCGRGEYSEESAFKTCLPGFPGAPSAIKISKSLEGAHLSWEPPQVAAEGIFEYSVYLAVRSNTQPKEGAKSQLAFVRVYCGKANTCVVPQSSLGAAHVDSSTKPAIIFRIAARNEKGYGPATQVRWLQDMKTGAVKRTSDGRPPGASPSKQPKQIMH